MITDQEKKCHFPFKISGFSETFNSCTSLLDDKDWCPHSVDENGFANFADKGFCERSCSAPKGNKPYFVSCLTSGSNIFANIPHKNKI